MAGISKKTPLPHWQKIMDKAGWHNASEMARAAKLPVGTAHDAIYGRKKPSSETILKVAKAARLDPGVILVDIFKYTGEISSTERSIAK